MEESVLTLIDHGLTIGEIFGKILSSNYPPSITDVLTLSFKDQVLLLLIFVLGRSNSVGLGRILYWRVWALIHWANGLFLATIMLSI